MVQRVPFRISFWFKAAFEDGQEENNLFKMGHGHLMISYESIEIRVLSIQPV